MDFSMVFCWVERDKSSELFHSQSERWSRGNTVNSPIVRLSQSRSHGFLVWCGRTRHERRRAFARSLARPSRSALVRSRLALTVALRAQKLDLWASLSHCGYPAITDTPRTVAKSPAKTIYRHLTEINSHSYGLSLKRTLTRGPYSVCNKGCWLLIGYNRTPGAWGFFSLGATGSSVVNCSGERRPLTDLWHPRCYNCARSPMETYCQLTVSLLTFI